MARLPKLFSIAGTLFLLSTPAYGQAAPLSKNPDESARTAKTAIDLLKKRIFLLASGSFQGGGYWLDAPNNDAGEGSGAFHLGGSVTLAGMPAKTSGFTLGARAHGGAFLYGTHPGHLGLSAVMGGTTGKRQDNEFGYLLGDLGFQYFPSVSQMGAALSFQGGASLGGFLVGGTLDMNVGPGVATILIGLDIGFGALLGGSAP